MGGINAEIFNLDEHRKKNATVAIVNSEDELLSFLSIESDEDNYFFTEEPEDMKTMSYVDASRITSELIKDSKSIYTVDIDTNETVELFNTEFRFEAVTIEI